MKGRRTIGGGRMNAALSSLAAVGGGQDDDTNRTTTSRMDGVGSAMANDNSNSTRTQRVDGLGQDYGDWGDVGVGAGFDAIPASQLDWSGDYDIATGAGNVIYDAGPGVEWAWGGGGDIVQQISSAVPPANPIAAGLDVSKLVQTATGLYKYVRQASGAYVPQKVSGGPAITVGGSPMVKYGLLAALAYLVLA